MKIDANRPSSEAQVTDGPCRTEMDGEVRPIVSTVPGGASDRGELSGDAALHSAALKAAHELPAVRAGLVERMRQKLDAGQIGHDSEHLADAILEFQRQMTAEVTQPGDDPQGVAKSLGERAEIARVEPYSRTLDTVAARLTVMYTALADIIDRLTRAQVAIASAQGSATPQGEREIAAQTLGGIRNLVLADLNTSFRGAHLFAGNDSTTQPFVTDPAGVVRPYQGSAREMSADIDEARSVTSGLVGSSISQGAAKTDVFSVVDAAAAAARTGDAHALAQAHADLRDALTRAADAQICIGTSLAAIAAQQPHLIVGRLAGRAVSATGRIIQA
jgi:hypothetical protein